MTVPELHNRHSDEERALIYDTLVAAQWRILAAAKTLDVTQAWLRRRVEADPELLELYARNNPGRGRPRTKT